MRAKKQVMYSKKGGRQMRIKEGKYRPPKKTVYEPFKIEKPAINK